MTRLSDKELMGLEQWAKNNTRAGLEQRATSARRVLRLVEEVRRNRRFVDEVSDLVAQLAAHRASGETKEEATVTVCDKCGRAECWQGTVMCEDARSAGTKEVPKGEA